MKEIELKTKLENTETSHILTVFTKATEFANKCNKDFTFTFRGISCKARPGGDPKVGEKNYSYLKDNDEIGVATN